MYCIMQFLKYIIPKPLKYSPMSLKSMRFQKCYNFHCSKCTKSILFQKEDASSSRRKCSQLLRMPNCCQKFLRGTLGKKNIPKLNPNDRQNRRQLLRNQTRFSKYIRFASCIFYTGNDSSST